MFTPRITNLISDGSAVEDLSALSARLKLLKQKHGSLLKEAEDTQEHISCVEKEISVCEESQEYYKRAVDLLYSRSIGELEALLNRSLAYVFYDKPYKVRFDLDFSRGKKSVSIILLDCSDPKEPIEIDIKDGVGNGIRTVISFILSVYYILSKNAYPILLLDESYSYLSAQYVQRFFEMIKGFCERKNLRVVLISHDVRFLDFSDKKYTVADGIVTEV